MHPNLIVKLWFPFLFCFQNECIIFRTNMRLCLRARIPFNQSNQHNEGVFRKRSLKGN